MNLIIDSLILNTKQDYIRNVYNLTNIINNTPSKNHEKNIKPNLFGNILVEFEKKLDKNTGELQLILAVTKLDKKVALVSIELEDSQNTKRPIKDYDFENNTLIHEKVQLFSIIKEKSKPQTKEKTKIDEIILS